MPTLADLRLPETTSQLQREVLEEVRDRTLNTCQRLGLIRPDRMTLRKYLAGRFEVLAALAYPDAGAEELVLCNDFNVCLFYIDDQADEDEHFGKRPVPLEAYFDVHIRALRDGESASQEFPAALLLLDLRDRLLRRASRDWLCRFSDEFAQYLRRGALAASRHWSAGTVPTVSDYMRHRFHDSAVVCIQNLIEVAGAGELTPELHQLERLRDMRRLCATVVAYTNDLVSYAKELRHNDSPNNLVHVLMTHEHLSLEQALERCIEIVNGEVAAFERAARALPELSVELNRRLQSYVHGQRAWMCGNLLWSLASGRYADANAPFAELRVHTIDTHENYRDGTIAL